MDIDLAALPDDVETLHRMVRSLAAERTNLNEAQAEIERLRLIIRKLQHSQFGRSAERLDDDQLQLGFEDLNADLAKAEAKLPPVEARRSRARVEPERPITSDIRPVHASGDRVRTTRLNRRLLGRREFCRYRLGAEPLLISSTFCLASRKDCSASTSLRPHRKPCCRSLDEASTMARLKSRKRLAKESSLLCMKLMIDRIGQAAASAEAAEMLLRSGQSRKAFEAALDIEQLAHEAIHALEAASMLRRVT